MIAVHHYRKEINPCDLQGKTSVKSRNLKPNPE